MSLGACQQFNHGDGCTEILILSCLLSMRLRTRIAEYNATVRRCATMAQAGGSVAPKRPLGREGLSAIARTSFLASTVVFFLIPSRFSLITYKSSCTPYRDTCHTEAREVLMPNGNNTMAISLSSL